MWMDAVKKGVMLILCVISIAQVTNREVRKGYMAVPAKRGQLS